MAAEKSGKEKLTPRQHAFVKNLAKGASQKDAFIAAGYKAKHPDQGAHQALKQIQDKVPQIMDEMGLEGKKRINVPALGIRHNALDTAFKLRGSYAPRDPKEAEQFGIKVLIVDISRPPRNAIDVTPRLAGGDAKPPTDNNGHD
jgi:phage terminase small subunit